jgi:hypothetical protein
MPDGGGDIQVHTDDMLIRPKRMYEYATKLLQEQKGLKLTCSRSVEAHVGVKIVYGTNEEGYTTVTLLQDQSIEKMHTAFKGLLDEREQVRKTKAILPMCTSFKPTSEHEVDILGQVAMAEAEMKKWPYRQILGHIMWICMAHPECWHASRVLARHSNHHTKYHCDSLMDCALFLTSVWLRDGASSTPEPGRTSTWSSTPNSGIEYATRSGPETPHTMTTMQRCYAPAEPGSS